MYPIASGPSSIIQTRPSDRSRTIPASVARADGSSNGRPSWAYSSGMSPRMVPRSDSLASRKLGSMHSSSGDPDPHDRPRGAAARDFFEAGLPERGGEPGPGEGRRERSGARIDRVPLDDASAPLLHVIDRG